MSRASKVKRETFKTILHKRGDTLYKWALRAGVTHSHLNRVLTGNRVSKRLSAEIAEVLRHG